MTWNLLFAQQEDAKVKIQLAYSSLFCGPTVEFIRYGHHTN